MALNRRSILAGLAGLAGGAATGATVPKSEMAKALGLSSAGASFGEIAGNASAYCSSPESIGDSAFWDLLSVIQSREEAKATPTHRMPAHIATKRSWSHVFKASEFARERALVQAYTDRLRQDGIERERFLSLLTGGR